MTVSRLLTAAFFGLWRGLALFIGCLAAMAMMLS